MHTELITIPTPTHPLHGAFHRPDGPSKGAALYFHGNQMNFYVGAASFLAPYITSLGYTFLTFNRRGHDTVSTFNSRDPVGGAFQTVAEGIEDNELAAHYLAEQGFDSPIIIGHSNGGVLASHFVAHHPETPALVLLSAHAGGNRLTNRASASQFSVNDNLEDLLKEARGLLADGQPRQLMLLPTWWHVISARTFMDRLTNVPDLVENAKRVQCRVLFIRGDEEPADNYPAEAFKQNCPSPCDVVIVPDCGHFYVGAEDRVAAIVSGWL
ncbi:MAG: alpha/beta hydrolase, partial [Acidobacteriota bacterium]